MNEELEDLMTCRCKEEYNIEKHGDGFALYWGRCDHRHGHNVLHITECTSMDILKHIERKLNNKRIPEGYKLVPVDVTLDMIDAANKLYFNSQTSPEDIYKAMIEASE